MEVKTTIRDKAFSDKKCTCECGNTHEYYGGRGYTTISCQARDCAVGEVGIPFYEHKVCCNECGMIHTFRIVGIEGD